MECFQYNVLNRKIYSFKIYNKKTAIFKVKSISINGEFEVEFYTNIDTRQPELI